ncbi:HNH endonuclease [Sphingobium abikonense]|uniref:HNH endonuclease n=1 Tax=Sphingobium abikonense TaxID=86193 RepID=UPI003515CA9C
MRKLVMAEEPICRQCLAEGVVPPRATAVADHIVNQAEGGKTVRSNYQGLCWPHSKAKTAKESGIRYDGDLLDAAAVKHLKQA